jgi:hypothetical protein
LSLDFSERDFQPVIVEIISGAGASVLIVSLRPLGHKACRDGRSVSYQRVPRLSDALALARGDGRHGRSLKTLARVELLILDDWGLVTPTHEQGRDLLEIVDDRHNRGSTIVTSQLPVDPLARGDRQSHRRRCHPRPARPQCPQAHAQRRQHAQGGSQTVGA